MSIFGSIGNVLKKALPGAIGLLPGGGTISSILGALKSAGSAVGLGRPGGLDAKHLLLAGGAGLGLKAAKGAAGKRDKYLEEAVQRNRDEYAASSPVRSAARSQLLDRLTGMGGTPMPDTSGLADTANPFRKNFNFSLQPPGAPAPALPPAGPVGLLPPAGGVPRRPPASGGGGPGENGRRKRERQMET